MKTLLALLSLTLVALAAVPPASAHSIDPIFPKCVTVTDFPDQGEWVCVDPSDSQCTVYEIRTTFLGTTKTCIYPFGGCGNGCATASAGSVNCYEVYSRTNVGPYSVVRRDSCAPPQAYVCPYENAPIDQCQDLLQFNAAAAQQQCLEYYSDWSIGPVHHHQTDSCNAQNSICEQTTSDVVANRGFDASKCDLGLAASSSASGPVDPLARRCSWSGQGELRTEYCIDPKDRDCTVYELRTTGVGSEWWCYPSGQHGSDY
jgi:hypothetical protein